MPLYYSVKMSPSAELLGRWYHAVMADFADDGAQARRLARAQAEVRIVHPGNAEAEANADALYWDRIPANQRAAFVWRLSLELHALSNPGVAYEPGRTRSTARIIGR